MATVLRGGARRSVTQSSSQPAVALKRDAASFIPKAGGAFTEASAEIKAKQISSRYREGPRLHKTHTDQETLAQTH